jgi:hypothetical protein
MAGQQKLQSSTRQPLCPEALSINHHTFRHGLRAGGNGTVAAFYLHKAESAASIGLRRLADSTQVRYVNTVVEGCPQHLLTLWGFYILAIYGQRDRLHL